MTTPRQVKVSRSAYLASILKRIRDQYEIDGHRLTYPKVVWKVCIREAKGAIAARKLEKAVRNHAERKKKKKKSLTASLAKSCLSQEKPLWQTTLENMLGLPIHELMRDAAAHERAISTYVDD